MNRESMIVNTLIAVFLLQRLGLQGLSQNTIRNKTHQINNNIAIQHCCQTVTIKCSIIPLLSYSSSKVFKAYEPLIFVFS